jgi:PAS domain S-box-containing protein
LGKNHRILKSGLQPDTIFEELWKTISSGKVWKGIICNKKKNGDFYWVKSTIVPVLDDNGIPKQIKLQNELQLKLEDLRAHEEETLQLNEELNITNEQLLEVQKELESQFLALNNAAIVSITDIRGNITYVNDTFCKISKYSREELIGKNHRIIRHPDMPASAFEELWKTITQGKVWKGVVKNRAKDGSAYWVHATITPILDEKGIPIKYISVRFDITSEMELSQLLNNTEKKVEELNSHLAMAQKALEKKLEETELEIQVSLNYAQRIQKAILPSMQEIDSYFPSNFECEILFQPKEAVSGDFYWGAKVHNRTIFFVGDATGHGVSGSFMSLIAINALEHLVKDKMVILPDILLSELDKKIKETLHQDANNERTVLDSLEGYAVLIENDKVSIASAMRPIYLFSIDNLQEIQGSKKSIGGKNYYGQDNFEVHTFQLQPNDTLYLCSDGFESQLGGHDGHQKFGKTAFKIMIEQIHPNPSLKKRAQMFFKRLQDWKGFFNEQNDDVIVAMIRAK